MRSLRTPLLATLLFAAVSAGPHTVLAYDTAVTHPGLTGQAALASQLHRWLQGLGHLRGLFESLGGHKQAHQLRRAFDPAAGYVPDAQGRQWAVGWLMAGSALEGTPVARERFHFFEPTTGRGLYQQAYWQSPGLMFLAWISNGETWSRLFSGAPHSALAWANHADNRYSVAAFYRHAERAATAATRAERRRETANALLAMGGLLNLLQDMASPTHVRNDFATGHFQRFGVALSSVGVRYERFVADRYGRVGLPMNKRIAAPALPRWRDYFHNDKNTGLADRTHRAAFSPGTLPVTIIEGKVPVLAKQLKTALAYPAPTIDPRQLRHCPTELVCHVRNRSGAIIAGYRVSEGRIQFLLDRRTFAAQARLLLPWASAYSTGLINHLTRGSLAVTHEAGKLKVQISGADVAGASLLVQAQDPQGRRKQLSKVTFQGNKVAVPVGKSAGQTYALTVLGKDKHGEQLVVSRIVSF